MAIAQLQDDDKFKLLKQIWPQMPRSDFNTYKRHYDIYFLFLDERMSEIQRKSSLYSVKSIEEAAALIEKVRRNGNATKAGICVVASEQYLRSIDVAVRLWLTIHVRHLRTVGDSSVSFHWAEDMRLTVALERWFTPMRDPNDSTTRQIPDRFSISNLIRYFKFEVKWTSDLLQHLKIDWKYKQIPIFEHVICLRNHLEYSDTCPLPRAVVEEAIDTINLLFPDDKHTKRFLSHERRTFLRLPYGRERSLSLRDYCYWRQNLSDLLEYWEQGPKGWLQIQLSPDQGNFLEYFTFWTAAIVLILTVMSIAFGVASLVLAKQALDASIRSLEVSILSYNLSLAVACAATNATEDLAGFCI